MFYAVNFALIALVLGKPVDTSTPSSKSVRSMRSLSVGPSGGIGDRQKPNTPLINEMVRTAKRTSLLARQQHIAGSVVADVRSETQTQSKPQFQPQQELELEREQEVDDENNDVEQEHEQRADDASEKGADEEQDGDDSYDVHGVRHEQGQVQEQDAAGRQPRRRTRNRYSRRLNQSRSVLLELRRDDAVAHIHDEWSPRGWIIPRETGKRAFFDIHIPKTAGCSVSEDIKKVIPTGEGYWSNERCLLQSDAPKELLNGDVDMAYFREPVSHVYSQFLECKYDKNWSRPSLPSWKRAQFDSVTTWLTHFSAGADQDDLGCYHPYNMQTRALTCKDNDCHHYSSEPPVDLGLKNLNSLGFVGLVEHYQASLCLFHAKAHDMNETLPTFCDCKNAAAWNSFHSSHEDHGLPSHGVDELSQEDKDQIKALTQKDELVYREALKRFNREIAEVENHFDVKLLC